MVDDAVMALEPGTCVVCLHEYLPGALLGLLVDGWAHLDCAELVTSRAFVDEIDRLLEWRAE